MPSSKSAHRTTKSSLGTTESAVIANKNLDLGYNVLWTQSKNVPIEHIGERSKSSQARYS